MDSYRGMRASDQDREQAIRTLREAYAAGRLDLAELRERAGAAYGARTWGDLRPLTADIPVWVITVPGRARPTAGIGAAVDAGPARLTAPALLIVLAAVAGVAAAWASAALIPLMILSACILLAAACSARHPAPAAFGPPGQAGHGPRARVGCPGMAGRRH